MASRKSVYKFMFRKNLLKCSIDFIQYVMLEFESGAKEQTSLPRNFEKALVA